MSLIRSRKDEEILMDKQKEYDEQYPREFVSSVDIKMEQWQALLIDSKVFFEKDIETIKKIYRFDNHAATCYDLSIQDGKPPSSYISPVVALGKRISAFLSLDPVFRDDGTEAWWPILFWGKYRDNGHFEWKIRPELVKAMQSVFPELEVEVKNTREDSTLVEQLKRVSLKSEQVHFEYRGKPKEKLVAVVSGGHKIYPRDRLTAINALVHAAFLCEVDKEHPTFIRKNSDKNYTEPHHLVPMAYYNQFDVSLDVEENIVSLCSNCHNQIHYGKGSEELLQKLYDERIEYLEKVVIVIPLKELMEMY